MVSCLRRNGVWTPAPRLREDKFSPAKAGAGVTLRWGFSAACWRYTIKNSGHMFGNPSFRIYCRTCIIWIIRTFRYIYRAMVRQAHHDGFNFYGIFLHRRIDIDINLFSLSIDGRGLGWGCQSTLCAPSPQSPEAVKKLGGVDRPEGYLQNCRMRTLKMYGSWVGLSHQSYMVFNPYH